MTNTKSIVVFDSGIGGFTITRALQATSHWQKIYYFADQANLPYGEKDEDWIVNRLFTLTKYFLKEWQPELIILACNSATVSAISALRAAFPSPFVGVEPVVKSLANNGPSLILATKRTLESERIQILLNGRADITLMHPKGLVEALEQLDHAQVTKITKSIARAASSNHIRSLGLCCTHYSLIKEQLEQLLGDGAKVIDATEAITKRALSQSSHSLSQSTSQVEYFTTGDNKRMQKQVSYYLGETVKVTSVSL